MPEMKSLKVKTLYLDLDNFRTTHQKNEKSAINTMIAIKPERFYALIESILENGFYPTENIIVLEKNNKYYVIEGNRRVASAKILFGLIKGIDLPTGIQENISKISTEWRKANSQIPCAVYGTTESEEVEKIRSLIHAKGEVAGRDEWTPVAKARYNREIKSQTETGLDLLEAYLQNTKDLTPTQVERWSGDYPLSILDEAIRSITPHLGFKSKMELSKSYPHKNKKCIDQIIYDIGMRRMDFQIIRDKGKFFGEKYGVKEVKVEISNEKNNTTSLKTSSQDYTRKDTSNTLQKQPKALASNDPKSAMKRLRSFSPKGNGREKLVTLLDEIRLLKIEKHPHAFCFLLRSMFEISAKAYCDDYKSADGPKVTSNNGDDKNLANLLEEITNHLTKDKDNPRKIDKQKKKELHGAISDIKNPTGLLSVTSLNQLIHNKSFSIAPNSISVLFGNIFPLLEEMNK